MELSLEFARERHNRSVERVADSMGAASHWVVYKWMESARLPAVLIRPFETACGIDFVTRYLAISGHRLVIDIPTGRNATGQETQELQEVLTAAVGLLLKFYGKRADREETAAALMEAIEALAWHHGNVQRNDEPELDFTGGTA